MFISWEAAVLGSLDSLQAVQPAVLEAASAGTAAATRTSPVVHNTARSNKDDVAPALKAAHTAATNNTVIFAASGRGSSLQQQQQQQQWEQLSRQSHQVDQQNSLLLQHNTQYAFEKHRLQDQLVIPATLELPQQCSILPPSSTAPGEVNVVRLCNNRSIMEGRSIGGGSMATAMAANASSGEELPASAGSRRHVDDPLTALAASSTVLSPLIQSFSFLAIATSYIGFILGLTDFLADALTLPSGRQNAALYATAVLPPAAVAVTYPDIFLKALDIAGELDITQL